jgi:hypothetical protein
LLDQIDVQGTSSQYYVRKNWKVKLPEARQHMPGAIPAKVFCIKVDYAEATGTHNTGSANYIETLYDRNEVTLPPQKDDTRVRTTIQGFPCILFEKADEDAEPVFSSKANFNYDKDAENAFGFTEEYKDFGVECWEFCNNTSDSCNFAGAILSDWQEDFEPRYVPESANFERIEELLELKELAANGKVTMTDAQKTGWYGVKEIFEDTTITVTYKQIKTKVTVENDNAKGGVTGVENGQLFEFGADAEISVMSNPGYIISSIKWNGTTEVINYDQQKYGYTFIATINENSTLEVTYSPLTKKVIVTNDDSKGTISGVTSGAEYGIKEGLIIYVTPKPEFVIKSVRWNGVEKVLSQTEKIEGYSFYEMVGETNALVVEYAVKNPSVAVDNDDSKGEITGVTNGQTFINGQDAEINIKAKPGYIISSIKWNGIAELINYDQQKKGYTFIVIVEKDSTLEVTYLPLTKQVVVTNNVEQGVVLGVENGTEYGINERLTITITPNAEYIIKSVKWNGNEKTLTETEKSSGVIIEEIVGETNALVVEDELK